MHFRLTSRERAEIKYKKTVLSLAREHDAAEQLESVKRYFVPSDSTVRNLSSNFL